VVKHGRARQATDYNIIQRMLIACCIIKATEPHSEYVILLVFQDKNRYANAPECYLLLPLGVMSYRKSVTIFNAFI
jgi:hypothetical protein